MLPHKSEFILAAACAAVFSVWNALATRAFSAAAMPFFLGFSLLCLMIGNRLLHAIGGRAADPNSFPLKFLLGFCALSLGLLLVIFLVPVALAWSIPVLFGVLLGACVWRSKTGLEEPQSPSPSRAPAILAVLLSLTAATLWSRDSLRPTVTHDEVVVFKPWSDSFSHAAQLATFSRPEVPMSHIMMAGVRLKPYHFAPYMVPAALTALTPTSAFQAFASFQVPFGVFLTGLGAFLLVQSWWGSWPGLAGSVAVFLPCTPYHGVRSHFMSYQWLLEAGPGTAYGAALLAVAWAFMFRACATGKTWWLFLSYVALVWTAFNKSQMFVAGAFLLWIWPALFMASWPARRRVAWAVFALASFFSAVYVASFSSYVPTLRLDGSATKYYMRQVQETIENDGLRAYFDRFSPSSSWRHDLRWGAWMLVVCTFGLFAPACLALLVWLRKRIAPPLLVFPLAIVAVYLVTSLGLALSETGYGTRDELLHRPLVWAYFAVAAWVGGAVYWAILGDSLPQGRAWRVVLVLLLIAPLPLAERAGRGVQRGPQWGKAYVNRLVPLGLVDCCQFLRATSHMSDVIQDSKHDPDIIVSALSERQAFLCGIVVNDAPYPGFRQREAALKAWWNATDEREIQEFAAEHGIRWAVVQPGDAANWPGTILDRPAFASQGYRVYHLP